MKRRKTCTGWGFVGGKAISPLRPESRQDLGQRVSHNETARTSAPADGAEGNPARNTEERSLTASIPVISNQ